MGDRAGGGSTQSLQCFLVIKLLFYLKGCCRSDRKEDLSFRPRFFTRNTGVALGLSESGRGNHLSVCFGNPVLCAVSSGSSKFRAKTVD